jgi:predicted amidophosphoribosyltransferase
MAYEREPRKSNATCPLCWRDFWRNANDDGNLCDKCADASDWRAQEKKRMATAKLKPRDVKEGSQ